MKIGVIYKITSPSKKIYIGQTINLKNRLNKYKSFDCKKQIKLYNSIMKYGWDLHIFEILEEINCEENKKLLNEREIYWIKTLNSFNSPFGLNCTEGGNGNVGRKCSEETKKKISLGNKGKIISPEARKKISEYHTGKRYTRTAETIKKISESKLNHIVSDETRKKISKFHKGKITSEETKEKIRKSNFTELIY